MADGAIRIAIPRWIQLVGLPLLLLLAWTLASTVGRAVFLFVLAGLIALLLNPIVRALSRIWIPRGIAIAVVYLAFAAAATFCVIDRPPRRQLFHDKKPPAPDGRRARRRPPADLAQHAPSQASQDPQAGAGVRPQHQHQGRDVEGD
jgi:hypothetical protein